MFMNNLNEIPETDKQFFKEKVTRWLLVDKQITDLQTQMKDLKKVRDKELQPGITEFMVSNNVCDLNTEHGKLRCQEKKTKKGLNKNNIRTNLSKFLEDNVILDEAVSKIMNEREIITKHIIKKVK